MKSISVLYETEESLTSLIEQKKLNCNIPYFVQVITSNLKPEKAFEIASFVQSTFSNATIMGFSSCALIYNGEQVSEGTLILFRSFEKTQVYRKSFRWDDKTTSELVSEIAESVKDKNARLMHVICGSYYTGAQAFVDEFNKLNTGISLVGGIAGGTDSTNESSFVFTPEEGVIENGIVIAAICGNEFSYYTGINTAHEPISTHHKLTKIENGVWKEVNGQDTKEWLYEQLGVEQLQSYSDWEVLCANDMLVHFPVVLDDSKYSSRFLRYSAEDDGITQYYSQVPEGTTFRIGYVDPSECLQESFRLCNEIMNTPIEDLFCYTCLFRRLYLQNCSEWELRPYKNANLCGAFMMGEICSADGKNELLNGSCCLVGVAENESYIRPNIHAFDELKAVGEDTIALLNIVLKRQQEATTRQNEKLMKTLIEQQQEQEKQMYIDFNTGIDNYLKFKEDAKSNNYNKLCIVKTENAELLITHLGHTSYLKIMRKVVNAAKKIIEDLYDKDHSIMQLYMFNESTFFIAADERMSENHFMNICKNLHEFKHLLNSDNEEVVISRFVVCLNQKHPIETALNSLAASKNTQTSFLVCDDDNNDVSSDEEFKIIGVLNRAIENDGIVPYFQGIYNNKSQTITYYEALMRIKDVDGTIYFPGQFIEIAKKYHMYSTISSKMLEKVFDLFSDHDEKVSLNISALDIQSEETKNTIFKKLTECKNPNNFVFEILEDEAYRDFLHLKEFISKIRECGARVAIDDFGSGYSNLYEISNIKFDIIKVDGGIIKNLPENKSNCKLLEVIIHMGRLFEAEIVAEFVENASIQKIVHSSGIDYSQGYLFAKPMPFEELHLQIQK